MDISGNSNKVYWRMKSGKMIDIDLMDENHLRNVLKMIVKNSNKHKEHKRLMEISPEKSFKEIHLNGDMANFFNDSVEEYENYED